MCKPRYRGAGRCIGKRDVAVSLTVQRASTALRFQRPFFVVAYRCAVDSTLDDVVDLIFFNTAVTGDNAHIFDKPRGSGGRNLYPADDVLHAVVDHNSSGSVAKNTVDASIRLTLNGHAYYPRLAHLRA